MTQCKRGPSITQSVGSECVFRLAICHTQVLIAFAKRSQRQLGDSLNSFLTQGGSLFWHHSNWGSILSLIMRHGASFRFLQECLFRQTEPWTVEELSPIDRWLIGILAHANTVFRQALQRYLDSYRTIFQSPTFRNGLGAFGISSIVSEVQCASTRDRVELLKIISKWGTSEMMEPFLAADLDINERWSNEQMPWLRLSYLSKAVRWGNFGMFQVLLKAGACPTWALIYLSRHAKYLPPCEFPERREQMLKILVERAEPQDLGGHDEGLLSLLLRTDDVRTYSAQDAEALINKFFLRRAMIVSQEKPRLLNSYILIAIFLDLPQILRHLYHSGLLINGNQIIGEILCGERVSIKGEVVGKYTWLTLAIHLGRASCVEVFLENGANIMEPDPNGRIALNMANDFAAGEHPRAATKLHIWPYQPPQRYPSIEDDEAILAALQFVPDMPVDSIVILAHNSRSKMAINSPGLIRAAESDIFSLRIWRYLQHMMGPLLFSLKDFSATIFRPLGSIAKAIKHSYHPATVWDTARNLSRLTFTEALFLRIIYLASLLALLLYKTIDCFSAMQR